MEDKIMEKLTLKLKEEMLAISSAELKESNEVLAKAKKNSIELIDKMNNSYDKAISKLKSESSHVNSLEKRIGELEILLSDYKIVINKLKTVSENTKFRKKYLK